MSREENDGSEQPTSSDPEHSLHLMRKMVAEEVDRRLNTLGGELQLMVIKIVRQEIKPAVIEGLLRKVVREEFQKLLTEGTRNEEERSLYLKFLGEVAGPVQTSKEFRAVTDGPLKVALFDATGNIVNSGPESSAEVEILLIDATGNGKECATTNEDFERTIIRTGDKKKPHFAKNVYVNLDNGVGSLTNQKLGQDSEWTKNWTCRLVARFVKNFGGLKVQKAWTAPFKVIDNRGELYKKHEPPFPDSEVWRVKEIGRAGEPRKRLESKLIKTVLDLLFWLTVNPKGLQEITEAGDKRWKTMVAHARTCKIDDKKMYHHKSSTEPHTGVIYDCVGELKGVIDESHFVPIDNLSADEKDHACKLLSLVLEPSAFVDRYNTSYNDEASLVQQYPYKPSNLNSSTICSIQQCWNENINGFQTAEPGCSSQSISPNNIYDESLVSRGVGPIPGPENIPTDLDDGMNGVQARTLSEIFEPDPNDMDPVQLNGGCQNSYCYNEAWIEELLQSYPTRFVDEYSHIEMSNAYDERGAAAVVNAYYFGQADPRELLVSPPNDMDPFQLNGGCQNSFGYTWSDEFSQFALSPHRMHTFAVDEYIHIEMSNGDDERAAAGVVNASIRWKQLFCVVTWTFSSSRRVLSVSVGHPPKRKKQRVG